MSHVEHDSRTGGRACNFADKQQQDNIFHTPREF